MKVKDLIEQLSEMDPDMDIWASNNSEHGLPFAKTVDGQKEGFTTWLLEGAEEADGFESEPVCVLWLKHDEELTKRMLCEDNED